MEKEIEYIRIESYEPNKYDFIDSDILFKLANNSFTELNLENVILGVITHSLENCNLPLTFNAIFIDNTFEEIRDCKIVIRGCFNYGKKFHTELWKGYNHLAIIDFVNGVPTFLKYLKSDKCRKSWDSNYFICQIENLKECKSKIEQSKESVDNFMRTNNNHIWVENNIKEFEYKKKELIELIEKFENGQLIFETLQADINELTGKTIDEYSLKSYWTYTSLNDFCETLLIKPIKDWKSIDDDRAKYLIKEMLENLTNDGILQRNGEALEKKYSKISGYVTDLIFRSDENNEIDILEKLKKTTTINL